MAIPISVSTEQRNFRLLELSGELVELLESENAPVLQLKSSESSGQTQTVANAVLCTANRSFEVRQVQSSNVLYILHQSPDSGYTSIAQCKGSLELVPSKDQASEIIRQVLPMYSSGVASTRRVTRDELIDDTPFSIEELLNAMTEICVIEKDAHIWIPEAQALMTMWKSLLTAATINGIKLDEPWDSKSLSAQVAEDGVNVELYDAVIKRLSTTFEDNSMITFDAIVTTTWVGQTMLQCEEQLILKGLFITRWQDGLPETWRAHADLALLQNKYDEPKHGFITAAGRIPKTEDAGNAKLPPKSKWHQKFRK